MVAAATVAAAAIAGRLVKKWNRLHTRCRHLHHHSSRHSCHLFSTTPWFGTQTFQEIMVMSFQRKLFKEKDSVTVIEKHENHTTWQNSSSYVTIRELQARKHNQFSVTKTSFAKDKIQKRRTSHDIKAEILELSWNKNCQLSYSWFVPSQTGGQWYSDTSPLSIPWPKFCQDVQSYKTSSSLVQFLDWTSLSFFLA